MPESTQPEPPKATTYPFYVRSEEERRRFDLSLVIATQVMEVEPDTAAAWAAARAIYQSDVPT